MLTRAALKNPYAVFAICMIALILGAVSYQKMRVDIFPEIKLPSILVTTFYRGLSPSEMEGAITLKMEQRFVSGREKCPLFARTPVRYLRHSLIGSRLPVP